MHPPVCFVNCIVTNHELYVNVKSKTMSISIVLGFLNVTLQHIMIISKADLYEAVKAYRAFLVNA